MPPLREENIYISKTFWLSGSIHLDFVREHQPTNLQLEKLTLVFAVESNLTLLSFFRLLKEAL